MMHLGQMTLVVAGLTILTTIQLLVSSATLQALMVSVDSEATIDAVSIGQSMIDEILDKSYDQKTISQRVYERTDLTQGGALGRDSNETVVPFENEPFASDSVFNDVDDYDGYTRTVITPRLGNFTVRDSVYYVLENNLDVRTTSQTWYKKVVVVVTHPSLFNPVVVKSLTVYRRYF